MNQGHVQRAPTSRTTTMSPRATAGSFPNDSYTETASPRVHGRTRRSASTSRAMFILSVTTTVTNTPTYGRGMPSPLHHEPPPRRHRTRRAESLCPPEGLRVAHGCVGPCGVVRWRNGGPGMPGPYIWTTPPTGNRKRLSWLRAGAGSFPNDPYAETTTMCPRATTRPQSYATTGRT